MMGSDLRLRSWGPLSEKLFNLKASDVVRSIFDINLDIQTPDIKGTIEEVVAQDVDKELEVRGPHGRWFLVRIRPYRTADNKIEGAVLAFVDLARIKPVKEEHQSR